MYLCMHISVLIFDHLKTLYQGQNNVAWQVKNIILSVELYPRRQYQIVQEQVHGRVSQ